MKRNHQLDWARSLTTILHRSGVYNPSDLTDFEKRAEFLFYAETTPIVASRLLVNAHNKQRTLNTEVTQ